jgi:hypothetical protein
MRISVNKVPGVVSRSLRKGSVTVNSTDYVSPDDIDSLVHGYLPTSTSVGLAYLNDTDVGIATFADVIGTTSADWPGTEFDEADDVDVNAPLTRFVGAA